MKIIHQFKGKNPFGGTIAPSRIPFICQGRPTSPFPHPWNYTEPLQIVDSVFHGADELDPDGRHNRYMDIPFLPTVLITRDPELIRAILIDTGDKPGQFDRDPSPAAGIARATGVDSLLYANGARWKRQKRLAASPFGRTSLFQPERFQEFEETFRETVAQRLERLRELQASTGKKVTRIRLEPEIQAIMLEMLVNNFFGANVPYDKLRGRYVPSITRLISHMVSDTVIPRSRNLLKSFGRSRSELNQARRDFEKLTDISLAGRAKERGLWKHFKSDATDDQLRSNIRVFLAGALEATTSLAAWTLAHLSRDLDYQERIYEEVKDIDHYDPDNLKSARYLNGAITETLRLTPSLYFLPRRATTDRTVKTGDGREIMIPNGTHVVLAVWHANRCEDFWGVNICGFPADQFAPQRWDNLAEQGKRVGDLLHFGFGHGPRACPGKYLGMLEVGLVVGAVLKLFRIRAVNKRLKASAGVSTKPSDGVYIDLKLRT